MKIRCKECNEFIPAEEWQECEVDCDTCGTHYAVRCPECGEAYESPLPDEEETYHSVMKAKEELKSVKNDEATE